MRPRHLLLPSLALGAAIVVTIPREAPGFALLGHTLNPNQSDFRVFDNFTNPEANDNTTPDPQFPGYTGAVLAIWKGCVEWSSGPHGDGSGDPSQAVLGSAGSNFDPLFNGEALDPGAIGDNIISLIPVNGGGTLAFFQGGNAGWWIRFHQDAIWADGPNANIPANQTDIQGVACHEFGHAVGLDHTLAPGLPTMAAVANGTGVTGRSIESDDILGAQALYGLANSTGVKPTVTDIVYLGSDEILIVGSNFKSLNNQVWLTRATPATGTAGGDPIKVTGLTSSEGGTQIQLVVPSTAGPGDLFVKRNSSGQESTSNPFPFDPSAPVAGRPAVASISPSQVPTLTAAGGASVVITGSGFTGSTGLMVNGKEVGQPGTSFSGSWSVDSDTQISFTMPLTGSIGLVDVEFTTPTGPASTQLEILPPTVPTLAASTTLLDQATGISFAGTAQEQDLMLLDFSVVDGATVVPGVLELEIGGGNLNNVTKLKLWTMGPKLWRKFDSGPLSDLPLGLDIFFEGLVLPFAQGYDIPWDSTNKVTITVNS